MKVEIQREPNLLIEARQLLGMLAEDTDIERIEKKITERGWQEDTWKPVITVVGKILKKAEKQFQKEMDSVREYFTPMTLQEDFFVSLADLAVMYNGEEENVSLEQREMELRQADEEWLSRKALKMLGQEEKSSLGQLILALEESSLTKEQKWKAVQVAVNPMEHFEKVASLLRKSEKLFLEFKKDWQPLADRITENWSGYLEKQDIKSILKQHIGAEIEENPKGVVLIPEIMNYGEFMYHSDLMNESGERKRDIYKLGYFFCTMESFTFLMNPANRKKDRKEYMLQVMKCFSDKSKLEILLLLKEREMYGSELAEALELTTATISHHMNALLIQQLVSVEQKGNKAYYRLNREEILRVMKMITELW